MYKDQKVCVVVPCYNEEILILRVIKTMPQFVDHIVVVNDCSTDNTEKVVRSLQGESEFKERLILVNHEKNCGVGAAIGTGYKWARDNKTPVTAVMAGDAQMDPNELQTIISPVINGESDYVKGNRLFYPGALKIIPKYRFFGNSVLSFLTKIASGYWHITDSQTGYTAISLDALETIDIDEIYPRYGMPNDLLVKLNIHEFRVMDVPIKPIYNIGEKSGIKLRKVIFSISLLLIRLFFKRLWNKYILLDFHPLVLFYLCGLIFLPLGFFSLSGIAAYSIIIGARIPSGVVAIISLILFFGLQLLLFAMWFDMDYNRNICINSRRRNSRANSQ